MSTRRRSLTSKRSSVVVVALAVALVATACIDKRVTVRFDAQSVGSSLNPLNDGSSENFTTSEVVTLHGGDIIGVPGAAGNGSAGDFPAHTTGANAPRAVIKITNSQSFGVLTPANRDFWFGADITLDATNATPNSNDDGNNVIQRGLFNETSQFKIEVDNARPQCRLKGTLGEVSLQGNAITPDTRYRIRCERYATTARLRVWPINADGTLGAPVTDVAKPSSIGPLAFDVSVPLSIGGKLNNNGTIAQSASDQFNGTIDNAILRIDFPEVEEPG